MTLLSRMKLDESNRCTCDCHTQEGISHFDACCQGTCEGCNEPFYSLKDHRKICSDWIIWAYKQKRAELRRLELYEEFRSVLSEGGYNDEII